MTGDKSPRPPSVTSPPVSVTEHTEMHVFHISSIILNMVGLRLNEAKSELEPVQDIQFLGLPWIKGELPSQYPKLGRYGTRRAEYPPRKPCRTEKCPNLWDHSIGPQVSSHWVIYTFIH